VPAGAAELPLPPGLALFADVTTELLLVVRFQREATCRFGPAVFFNPLMEN
jgi:hypothetical protein